MDMRRTGPESERGLITLATLPRSLAAAPHRLPFFAGATALLFAMAWWTLMLIDQRCGVIGLAEPPVHAGWAHAIVMQYQVLTPFIFGFLLTVFPRWLNLEPVGVRAYLPVGIGLFLGYVLTTMGLFGVPSLLHAGVVLTLAAWTVGLIRLIVLLAQRGRAAWHAISCAFALAIGLAGFAAFAVFLHTHDARLVHAAVEIGGFGFLLPIYFTVCHRMLSFFAGCVIPGYRDYRPMWALAAFWVLALAHLSLELLHGYRWLWMADAPLAALTAFIVYRWWPRAPMPGLLRVLFLGLLWLPVGVALYGAQSAWFALTGEFALGRAPIHAIAIGYFGSLLVAMVTRVSHGHSGRALAMTRSAWFAFGALQVIAVMRIAAEVLPDAPLWHVAAGVGWLIALAPWVARCAWITSTPRVDGRPG